MGESVWRRRRKRAYQFLAAVATLAPIERDSNMTIYHCHLKTITKLAGNSAEDAAEYRARRGRYRARGNDVVVLVESHHMPAWARHGQSTWSRDAAIPYWRAADRHERTNGRLCKSLEFALPDELDAAANAALARKYLFSIARDVDGGNLPLTFAIHAKVDSRGRLSHFHVHGMVSERVNDGIERSPEQWFRRATPKCSGRSSGAGAGGARKTMKLRPQRWLHEVRKWLADYMNEALEAHGRPERVDHRSFRDRGIDREPEPKLGYRAAAMERLTPLRTWRGERVRAIRAARRAEEEARAALQDARRFEEEVRREDEVERLEREADMFTRRRRWIECGFQVWVYPVLEGDIDVERARAIPRSRALLPTLRYEGGSWMIDRMPGGVIRYSCEHGRVLDLGDQVGAEAATDAELDALVDLCKRNEWSQIQVEGDARFKARMIGRALQQSIDVVAAAMEDNDLIGTIRAEVSNAARAAKADPLRQLRESIDAFAARHPALPGPPETPDRSAREPDEPMLGPPRHKPR